MIQIQNIPLPIGSGEEQLRKRAARFLGLNPGQLRSLTLARQSIDARKKSDVHYVCTVHVEVDNEARIMARCRDKNVSLHAERPYAFPPVRRTSPLPPVVVGMGPAGLFAALFLARNGVIPIVLERGRPVEERTADVERFWATGVLDTTSNVQFGEGGAGTFSDGKLTTGTHDPRISTVFRTLVEAGAPADILYQHKPHIGTDILRDVVRNVRRELLALGCDVRFGHRLAGLDVRDGVLRAVAVDGPGGRYDLPCDALVLSPGHSARDTFQMLLDTGVPMAPKPFAIGVRIEHAQAALSEAQFGPAWERLPAADYKLACHLPTGRSAFTFCVCPGGQVVAAASEEGRLVTNGRGQHQRRLPGGGVPRRLRLGAPPGGGRIPAPLGGGGLHPGRRRLPRPGPDGGRLSGPAALHGPGAHHPHLPPRRHPGGAGPLPARLRGRHPAGCPPPLRPQAPRLCRAGGRAHRRGEPLLLSGAHPPGRGLSVPHPGPLPLRRGGWVRGRDYQRGRGRHSGRRGHRFQISIFFT